MTKMLKVTVDTGFVGGVHEDYLELPEYWSDLSEEKQQEYIDEEAEAFLFSCCGYEGSIVDV